MYTRLLCIIALVMTISVKACDNIPKPKEPASHHSLQTNAFDAAQQLDCDKLLTFIQDGVQIDPQVHHNVAYCAVAKQQWPLLANALNHPDSSAWWNLAHHKLCTAECIALLAQHKINLNHPGKMGNTPLHNAVARWDEQAIKTLIKYRAKVHAKNMLGQTPAHIIVEQMGENPQKAVQLLLTLQKATRWHIMHTKNGYGDTPAGIIDQLEHHFCDEPDKYSQQYCITLISSLKELKEYYHANFGKGASLIQYHF